MDPLGTSGLNVTPDSKLLRDFRKLSASAPKNGAKSMVQMSGDGNSVMSTRRNSALAKFIARVFTKLSSMDCYDMFGIANPERQQAAVAKFLDILDDKYHYQKTTDISTKSLSLADLENILQNSGANSLREMFSISNSDQNKIASGNFTQDMKNFAGIEITSGNQEHMRIVQLVIYDRLKADISTELDRQGFSSDEIGYVLASMIEEAKPFFQECSKYSDGVFEFKKLYEDLMDGLVEFIDKHSQKFDNDSDYEKQVISDPTDEALRLMLGFSKLSELFRGPNSGEELRPYLAKCALSPVFIAATKVRHQGVAWGNIAIGGGTALATLIKQSSNASKIQDPNLARCAKFEPMLAVMNMTGLTRGATNHYQDDMTNEKINPGNVKKLWINSASSIVKDLYPVQ